MTEPMEEAAQAIRAVDDQTNYWRADTLAEAELVVRALIDREPTP